MYARIENNVVVELIPADPDVPLEQRFTAELVATMVPVALADVAEGWRYDGGSFAPPATIAPPPQATIRVIAPLAFRRRMSTARRREITLAAAQAMAATPPQPALQVWLDDLNAAKRVELDHPDTIAGVALLQGAGLLTEAEAAALLADGTPEEMP